MANQEPESQIMPPDHDYHSEIPSSPPIIGSMLLPNAGNGLSRSYARVEEPESQQDDRQPESYLSRIEDTQFVSAEPDTQFPESYPSRIEETQFIQVEKDTQSVDEIVFPSNHQNPQLPKVNIPTASSNVASAPAPLISRRPSVDDINDLATGFTFKPAGKIEKGKFNRPPPRIPVKSQRTVENPSDKGQSYSKFHFPLR